MLIPTAKPDSKHSSADESNSFEGALRRNVVLARLQDLIERKLTVTMVIKPPAPFSI